MGKYKVNDVVEGLVTGIGANMFKLSGSVIVFGIVSAYILGLLRLVIGG